MNKFLQWYHSGLPDTLAADVERAPSLRYLASEIIASGADTFSIWLQTDQYAPNHIVTLRNSVDGRNRDIHGIYEDGFWKFIFPADAYLAGMTYWFLLDGQPMISPELYHPGPRIQFIPDFAVHFLGNQEPSAAAPADPPATATNIGFSSWYRTDQHTKGITIRNEIDNQWATDVHGKYEDGFWKFDFPAGKYPLGFRYKFLLNGVWMDGDNLRHPGLNLYVVPESAAKFPTIETRYPHPLEALRVREDEKQQSLVRNYYDEEKIYDVVIIGSGMGGGVLADALSDRGVETLVLDAGCLDFETHIYNLPGDDLGAVVAQHQVGDWTYAPNVNSGFGGKVMMNLGGRSVFWSGIIPQMQPWELEQWPAPVKTELPESYYAQAERLMRKHVTYGSFQEKLIAEAEKRFPQWKIQDTPRAHHQPELGPKVGAPPPSSFVLQSTGTFSTAELLLDSLSSRGKGGTQHLYVNLNHLVLGVEPEKVVNGEKFTSVVCEDLVGNCRRTYRGRNVVLAAGSMGSVRVALQSKLDLDHPLVGVGFADHPSFFIGYNKDIPIRPDSPYHGDQEHARIFFYPPPGGRNGVNFNVEIGLNPRFWRERHTDNEIQDDKLNSYPKTTVNFKFVFSYPLVETNYVKRGGDRGKMLVRMERVPWNHAWQKEVTEMCMELLEFFGAEKVSLDPKDRFLEFGDGGTPHHAGGTLRMGMEGSSVVDTNLKFHHRDDLYACDVSVFPMIPAANPSLTLSALALRLADHLTAKLQNGNTPVVPVAPPSAPVPVVPNGAS